MRLFSAAPGLLVLLAGAGALWIYFFVISVLPEAHSRVELSGLGAEVRVVRDAAGVPGILGETEQDVAMVLGYVMAQDRLWQMDYLRRASQGRLAEILGPEYLDQDHIMRIARIGESEQKRTDRISEDQRRWLESFLRGVNSYISTHAGKLPLEFSLLEYKPEPFSLKDLLELMHSIAWETSPAPRVDPVLVRILARLGKERALGLFPGDPAVSRGYVPGDLEGWEPQGALFSVAVDRPGVMRLPGLRGGAVWAVGRTGTRSGNPMVGFSAYQVLSAPGFWYRARLATQDFHLAGAFFPGLPVAVSGSNQSVAWGAISCPVDDADLYIERLDSDQPKHYWKLDRWTPLRETTQAYRVKGGRSVSRTVMLTETGPIVSEAHNECALSLRWTGRDGLGFLPAFHALNRAKNGQEAKNALRELTAPALNVVWADAEGAYGIQMAGLVPVRPPGSDGVIPMPAWTSVHDWLGFIPFDHLPSATAQADAPAAVADGRPGGLEFPMFMGCYWNDELRLDRIREILGQTREHSRETFQKIEGDAVSPIARDLVPILLEAFKGTGGGDKDEESALNMLGSWDFQMQKESAGAAVFGLFFQGLAEETLRAPLGDRHFKAYTQYSPLVQRLIRKVFVQKDKSWLGAVEPEGLLRKSFSDALRRGRALLGESPSKWKWGKLHTAEFRHPLTSRSRFLEMLYHVGPVGLPGAGDSIDCGVWSALRPFQVIEGVSLRQIVDMGQPPEIVGVSPLGSSAHFFSPHYKDQTQAWADGRYFHEPVVKADIRQDGSNAVMFFPAAMKSAAR
jgi:penicillin amidase